MELDTLKAAIKESSELAAVFTEELLEQISKQREALKVRE